MVSVPGRAWAVKPMSPTATQRTAARTTRICRADRKPAPARVLSVRRAFAKNFPSCEPAVLRCGQDVSRHGPIDPPPDTARVDVLQFRGERRLGKVLIRHWPGKAMD